MLPKNLLYQTKTESAAARSYKSNIAPQNGLGPYGPNQTIIINIPTAPNLVTAMSENYLKFDATFKNGPGDGAGSGNCNYIRLDNCGAHSFIQRIRVFHGSVLLSDINNYNQLASLAYDLQVSTPAAYGKYNILTGSRNDTVTTTPVFLAAAVGDAAGIVTTLSNVPLSVTQINSGIRLNTAQMAENAETTVHTFCLNLISIIGTLCPKYFPLFECTAFPLRVEIQLAPNAISICNSSVPLASFALNNVEYVMNCIELSDTAIQSIKGSTGGGPLQFVFSDYSNIETSMIASTGSSLAIPCAFKYASIRSLFIAMRDRAKTDAIRYFPFSNNTFNLESYTFRLGSKVIPTKAPENYIEMYSEVLKAIGSMSDINHAPAIELRSYSRGLYKNSPGAADGTSLPTQCGTGLNDSGNVNSDSFYVGIDLENYPNADKERIWAGYNSNNDDIFYMAKFGALTAATNISFGIYCMFDAELTFQNGQCYISY